MKTLALVPARSGSKGIPNKNIRMFAGKPLLAWAVEVGKATCDLTLVSTDSADYARIAEGYGAGVIMRPPELASDETPMLPVIQHALASSWVGHGTWRPDVVVLLQPTSPLRTAEQVRKALEAQTQGNWDSVVSVGRIPAHFAPDYALRIRVDTGSLTGYLDDESMSSVQRRQAARPAYYRDGLVYVIRRQVIEAGSLYGRYSYPVFLAENSLPLDTEADWEKAEAAMLARIGA